jgi:hypothetical protein
MFASLNIPPTSYAKGLPIPLSMIRYPIYLQRVKVPVFAMYGNWMSGSTRRCDAAWKVFRSGKKDFTSCSCLKPTTFSGDEKPYGA